MDGLDWTDVDELPRVVAVESRCGVRARRRWLTADGPAFQLPRVARPTGSLAHPQTPDIPEEPDESALAILISGSWG